MEDRIKPLIVLDFDGVITKIVLDWNIVRKEIFEYIGVTSNSFLDFFNEYFGTPEYYIVSDLLEKYEINALNKVKPYPDVKKAFKLIGASIIASMQTSRVIMWFLTKNNLAKYVIEILGRERFKSKKDELLWIKKRYRKPIIFIDDKFTNYLIAKKLGFQAYILRRDNGETLYELLYKILYK